VWNLVWHTKGEYRPREFYIMATRNIFPTLGWRSKRTMGKTAGWGSSCSSPNIIPVMKYWVTTLAPNVVHFAIKRNTCSILFRWPKGKRSLGSSRRKGDVNMKITHQWKMGRSGVDSCGSEYGQLAVCCIHGMNRAGLIEGWGSRAADRGTNL